MWLYVLDNTESPIDVYVTFRAIEMRRAQSHLHYVITPVTKLYFTARMTTVNLVFIQTLAVTFILRSIFILDVIFIAVASVLQAIKYKTHPFYIIP